MADYDHLGFHLDGITLKPFERYILNILYSTLNFDPLINQITNVFWWNNTITNMKYVMLRPFLRAKSSIKTISTYENGCDASVMLIQSKWCSRQLKQIIRHLVQQHYASHCEELAIYSAWREVKLIREIETLMTSLYCILPVFNKKMQISRNCSRM
jgi:hypothetical protein